MTDLHWNAVQRIDKAYLEEHLQTISWEGVKAICIDEVSYKKRHKYLTIISDLNSGEILEIVKTRRYKPVAEVIKKIPLKSRRKVRWVSTDMWKAYLKVAAKLFPNAEVVLDKFHLVRHLNEAVDQVRKEEQNKLEKSESKYLKNSRWLFLYGQEKLDKEQIQKLEEITRQNARLYEAYLLKERFRSVINQLKGRDGKIEMARWIKLARTCQLKPIWDFAKMILRHYRKIVNYFHHPISSGLAEGLNNLIATVKKKAYGYRNMEYFKLKIRQQNLKPILLTHNNV